VAVSTDPGILCQNCDYEAKKLFNIGCRKKPKKSFKLFASSIHKTPNDNFTNILHQGVLTTKANYKKI